MSKQMRRVGLIAVIALIVAGGTVNQGGSLATPVASPISSADSSPVAFPIATPITTTGASPVASPAASPQFTVAGNAFHLLKPGTPDELSLIAHGPITGATEVPVIVRNNTGQVQAALTVGAEARSADGRLVGAAASSTLNPPIVEPGGLSMGSLYFNPPLPEGATVTFYPEGDANVGIYLDVYKRYSGMELTEFSALPGRLLGTVRSTGGAPVTSIILYITCFDASGTPIAIVPTIPVRQNLGPGESSAFETRTQAPCDSYLVTGVAF